MTDHLQKPTGILVRKGYFCYIYTTSESFLDLLIRDYFASDFYGFSGLSNFVANYLEPHFTLQWDSRCDLYFYPSTSVPLHLKKRDVKTIPPQFAEEIDSYYTYKDDTSKLRILESLNTLPSSGYFDGDELVSWVLVHEDNSMGIMYTKEAYRGMGIAIDVTIDLCEKVIAHAKTPYLQINQANTMSPGLALKCGFVPYVDVTGNAKGNAIWFWGYRLLPQAFSLTANALNVTINRLLSLYRFQPEMVNANWANAYTFSVMTTEAIVIEAEAFKHTHNICEYVNIHLNQQRVGTLELYTHDSYWCFLKALNVDFNANSAPILLALAGWLKSLNRDSLLFFGDYLDHLDVLVDSSTLIQIPQT